MKKFLTLSFLVFSFLLQSQTKEELALSFIKKLERNSIDSCYMMMDTSLSNQFPIYKFKQMWESLPKYVGEYKSYSDLRTEKKDTLEIIMARFAFEKTKLDMQLSINKFKKIDGLFFTPAKSNAAYTYPEYAQPTKFYETKLSVKTGTFVLPGILCVPNNITNPPVVILLAGSGPNDKDETIGGNKVLKDLALGLATNGIASLRYDKRTLTYGKELLAGDFGLNEEVIEDAVSAAEILKANPLTKDSKIFVLGHSLGGMSAPLVASKSKLVNGIILLAGNARPLEDLLLEQYTYIFGLDSLTNEEKKELENLRTEIKTLKDPKLLKNAKANDLPMGLKSSYWKTFVNYKQLEVVKKIKQPVLVLQGERDYQVTMVDFNLWKQNLSNDPKNQFISYPDLNHLFMTGTGKATPAEYEKAGNVKEKVILDIVSWIKTK